MNKERKNMIDVGESMLINISEIVLSKNHSVKVKNFPGASTEKINKEIDDLLESKTSVLIVHAGTNDLTKQVNSLNSFKKSVMKFYHLQS